MNKSKFLKKSLAMLLALMLVVAMIPLSAAAAAPEVAQIMIDPDNGSSFVVKDDDGDGTYTGKLPATATEFDINVYTGRNAAVYYVDDSNAATPSEVAFENISNPATNANTWETNAALSVDDFEENGVVSFELRVYNAGDRNDPDVYTVELTQEVPSSDTSILELALENSDNPPVPQLGETVIDGKTIKITMPYGNSTIYKIRSLKLADGAVANKSVGVTVADEETITVTNGGTETVYTFDITVASGFTSFGTEESLDSVMFPDQHSVVVLLPYGYTDTNANATTGMLSLVPEFELDYPSAKVLDEDGNEVVSGKTELSVPASEVWDSTSNNFAAFGNTSGAFDWADAKSVLPASMAEFFGKVSGVNTPANNSIDGTQLTIEYVEGTSRTYDVYFYETAQNNEAVITDLTIGSETATIDQASKTIEITLPAGTDASSLDLDDDATKLTITASDKVSISVPAQSSTFGTVTEANVTPRSITDTYTSDGTLNASDDVLVRVTSQDGLTTTNYTLKVNVSDNYQAPKITSMYLMAPNSTEAIQPTSTSNNTFVFNVPYSVYDRSELEGYKVFYSKTVGATATYVDDGTTTTTLPRSGMKLDSIDDDATNDAYDFIPVPGSNQKGVAIEVSAKKGGSVETDKFYIQINRVAANTDATLDNFALTSTTDPEALDVNTNQFNATVDQAANTVTVEVPWSVYQYWGGSSANAIGKLYSTNTIDSSAKVFYRRTGENVLNPLVEVSEDTASPTGFGRNAKPAPDGRFTYEIVVLSEKAWVDAATNGWINADGKIDSWTLRESKLTNHTGYQLVIKKAKAETSADLNKLTLVDASGWTANLNVDIKNNVISSKNVPYAFTSDVANGSFTPVFLDYDVAKGAHVLSLDTGIASVSDVVAAAASNDMVPTASARFNDVGDIKNPVDYTGNFLVLNRKANSKDIEVLVYSATDIFDESTYDPVSAAQNNHMLVVNEDAGQSGEGSDFHNFTFDLDYSEPNTEAIFKSFSINGYKGVIDQTNHTITVTLPYGTEYTYLTPVYTTSDYATVTVDDPALAGKPLKSGVTDVNFSTSREFTVRAENEDHYTTYTVNVEVSDQFTDVNPGDWFYDNVMGAVQNGYMSGLGDGTFGPMKTATRAQFASALACAMGYEAPEDPSTIETPFIAVDANDWYAGAVNFCYDEGIISGYEDATFRPDQTITRQEAAAMLNNAFGLEASTDVSKFTDAGKIASWATAHVAAVANAELMNGDAAGTFRPTGTLTRAELASILMNANIHGFID